MKTAGLSGPFDRDGEMLYNLPMAGPSAAPFSIRNEVVR